MATLEELNTQRARLEEIRGKGITEYSIKDRSLSYRSHKELSESILEIDRQIAALSHRPVRRILVGTTKGF